MAASSLDVKIQNLRQITQEKLRSTLYSIPGHKKDLIIDSGLIKSLEHVCGASMLRSNGINKIYKFDENNIPIGSLTLIYLIPCNMELFTKILNQIKSINGNQPENVTEIDEIKRFHIIIFPTTLHNFNVAVENEGLHGLIELHRFNWDLLVMDTDLLSLELPQLYREVFIKMDTALLNPIAHSLRLFNTIFKKPSMILSYGKYSEEILKQLNRIEGFSAKPSDASTSKIGGGPDFSTMLIIDRSKDYASCLLTPVVYSGLLLEVYPSTAGYLHIDATTNLIKSNKLSFLQIDENRMDLKNREISRLRLSGYNDQIFENNRYKHISDVVSLLSSQAKCLGMEDNNFREMKLKDMQEYVARKLPKVLAQKRDLFKHLILCETIVNELGGQFEKLHSMEESMLLNKNKKQTFSKILETLSVDAHQYNSIRHICLLHLTCGLTQEEAIKFVTSYLNAFGYKYMPIFPLLANVKLFPAIENSMKTTLLSNISISKWQNQFQQEANKLKLFPNLTKDSMANGDDFSGSPSHVFNGTYTPLIAQLCKILFECKQFDEFNTKCGHMDQLKLYRYFDRQSETIRSIATDIKGGNISDIFPMKLKTIFVFIVGGVTYAEMAACNLIGRMCGGKIVVASNCILSGSDLIKAAFD